MHRGAQPLIQQPLPRRHQSAALRAMRLVQHRICRPSWVRCRRARPFRRLPAGSRLARSVNEGADTRGGLMEASITLRPGYVLPEEEQIAATYQHLLRRLSHQSVVKHFDAYADIDWDADEYRIDPEDPRWELGSDDVLGATAWYRAQPQADRKSTRLNSSHVESSYAVFCLKKKKKK